MLSSSRFVGVLIGVLLSGGLLLAQDRDRDKDRKDRDADDRGSHADYDSVCDQKHTRDSRLDYLFLPGFPGGRGNIPVAVNAIVNGVAAMPFHLDRCFRVGHVNLGITVAEAGSHAYAGIYDAQGNLLVQGKFPTDEVGDLTVAVSPRVLLKPGMYYFAIGGEGAGAAAAGYYFDSADLNFIHSGLAANPIMDGSLPPTLGTVTPPQLGSTPSAVFTH